jgi:hypothetical protein
MDDIKIQASLIVNTILASVVAAGAFVAKRWISRVDEELEDLRLDGSRISERLAVVETKADDTTERLDRIEHKIDQLLTERRG